MEAIGLPVVFTRLGVALAMVFVSFPFVVRTMQPVIQVGVPAVPANTAAYKCSDVLSLVSYATALKPRGQLACRNHLACASVVAPPPPHLCVSRRCSQSWKRRPGHWGPHPGGRSQT
jgi:hypothetical protein